MTGHQRRLVGDSVACTHLGRPFDRAIGGSRPRVNVALTSESAQPCSPSGGTLRPSLAGFATMELVLGDVTYTAAEAERAYRTWVRDGRLVGLPAKRRRRLPLLDLVAQDFEPGRSYTADEVQARLARWHPDTAALGRYLVDEGFLDRLPDGSRWWRSGGTVDLDVDVAVVGRLRSSGPGGPARAATRP